MFFILIINLAFSLFSNAFPAIMSGYGKFTFQKAANSIRTVFRFFAIVLLLVSGFNSISIVTLDTILNIIVAVILSLYVFFGLKVKIKFGKPD